MKIEEFLEIKIKAITEDLNDPNYKEIEDYLKGKLTAYTTILNEIKYLSID